MMRRGCSAAGEEGVREGGDDNKYQNLTLWQEVLSDIMLHTVIVPYLSIKG